MQQAGLKSVYSSGSVTEPVLDFIIDLVPLVYFPVNPPLQTVCLLIPVPVIPGKRSATDTSDRRNPLLR